MGAVINLSFSSLKAFSCSFPYFYGSFLYVRRDNGLERLLNSVNKFAVEVSKP